MPAGLTSTFALAVIAILLILGCQQGGEGVGHAPAKTNDGLQPLQQRAFGVLNDVPDTLPGALRRAIETTVAGRGFGLEYDLSQRVSTSQGVVAWIVPGDGYICVIRASTATAGCNTTQETVRHGMSLVAIDDEPHPLGRYLLLGIVPDRARTVAVRLEDGLMLAVAVEDNVYSLRASEMPRALPISASRATDTARRASDSPSRYRLIDELPRQGRG